MAVSLAVSLLSIGVSFAFNNLINKSYAGIKTWSNTESTYVAYDSRTFDNNCFAYYGKALTFNLIKEKESIRLPSFSYQFLEGVNYDLKSLINEKNIIVGSFSKLKDNEIAISKTLSDKYKKEIGDSLYLNGSVEYRVKYITADFYAVNEASINSDTSSIFVGSSSTSIGQIESYAVFDNVSREYNKVFSFQKIKNNFRSSFIIGFCSFSLTIVALLSFSLLFYKKSKMVTLNQSALTGSSMLVNRDLLTINFWIFILPFIPAVIVFSIISSFWIPLLIGVLTLLFFITDTVIAKVRIK